MLGLRAHELIGKSCLDLVHPEDKESVMAASASLSATGEVSTLVFRVYRLDGSVAWVEINFKQASEGNDRGQRRNLSACCATSRSASGWKTN